MAQISPYINFDGNCREALTFYKESLGGEMHLMTVAETPMAAQCPAGMHDQIMHGSVTVGDAVIFGSDMADPNNPFTKGNTMAISINCTSEEEISRFFNALSEGGKVHHPLREMFWGALFGGLADKYGIRWMFNYDRNSGRTMDTD